MKRSRRQQQQRKYLDYDRKRHGRPMPIIAGQADPRAPAPEDARLVEDINRLSRIRDGHIPKLKRNQ